MGRVLIGVLLFATALAACEGEGADAVEETRVLELAHDTIQLPAGVRLHQVMVQRSEGGDFEPAQLQVPVGDVVRFTAGDRGGHAIAFDGAAMDSTASAWLESTGQLRSPPLITTDAAWVITLEGAPPGVYPFRCTTHNTQGTMTVVPRG